MYALGVILYEMLTGKPIKQNELPSKYPDLTILEYQDYKIPEFVKISSGLLDIMTRCLKYDPSRRLSILQLCHHYYFNDTIYNWTQDPLNTKYLKKEDHTLLTLNM